MKSDSSSPKYQRGSAATWVFVGFAAVALFFLLTEHRAHLYGWLPFLLLAACPLLHMFHGHGGHGGHEADPAPRERDENAQPAGTSKTDTAVPPAPRHH